MTDIEKENVDMAGATSRLSDDEIGHFSPQTLVKIKHQGYSAVPDPSTNHRKTKGFI